MDELLRAEHLGPAGVVMHLDIFVTSSEEAGLQRNDSANEVVQQRTRGIQCQLRLICLLIAKMMRATGRFQAMREPIYTNRVTCRLANRIGTFNGLNLDCHRRPIDLHLRPRQW